MTKTQDQKLDQIIKILQEHSEKLEMMDKRFEKIEQRLAKIEERMDRLEQRMDQLEERMNRLEERMDRLEERMDRLEERMDQLEERMDQLEQRVENLKEGLSKVASGVIHNEFQIKELITRKEFKTHINEMLNREDSNIITFEEIHNDNQDIKEKLKRHDRMILSNQTAIIELGRTTA